MQRATRYEFLMVLYNPQSHYHFYQPTDGYCKRSHLWLLSLYRLPTPFYQYYFYLTLLPAYLDVFNEKLMA